MNRRTSCCCRKNTLESAIEGNQEAAAGILKILVRRLTAIIFSR
jgi:hypothetical protein